uniref:All-trans-retinol 13,14-reductase n=1 Tax=Sinocyclocheilus grahami TaxID=75366 RepID=A0A672NST6_SINGR
AWFMVLIHGAFIVFFYQLYFYSPLKTMVFDRKLKNKVLKQGFLASKVPQDLDAVVVGSGIGGLAIAVLLAKVGKKVLVLEQHDWAGGCCHTFTERGFEFDPFRCVVDQLINGQLQWEPLENPFDKVVLGPPENRRIYPIYSGKKRYIDELKKCFPGEEKAIDEYVRLSKVRNKDSVYLTDVVSELTQNKDLRAVMSYIFGTYDASFSLHSLLLWHYLNGAWYPKGGASEIAYHMIPIIEKAGGAVLVRAPVNRILLNDVKEAIGVSVLKGQEEVHVHAPLVISDAGIFNTYERLLPKNVQTMSAIQKQLSMVQHGDGGLSIFIGVDGTKEELGLKADNYFIFPENNLDELIDGYMNGNREESCKKVPIIFVASPSAKDSTWPERSPGKSTVSVVSFANYAWFEEWKDDKVKNRSIDYKELKEAFINSILEAVTEIYPKIKDRIEYVDAGTQITNQRYIAAPKGEIYGVDHDIARFNIELNATIRPQTPIKNLFLTGQDVMFCGFAGRVKNGNKKKE